MTRSASTALDWNSNLIALIVIGSILWLALPSFVFMRPTVKVVRAEKVPAQHLKRIFVHLNLVFCQMLAKESSHQIAGSLTLLRIFVVESLGMRCL